MQKVIITVLSLAVAGCSFFPGVHKIDIQQGNVIEQKQVDQLRPGMTRSQVRYVLGTPILIDTFHQERWDYLFTLQQGSGERDQEHLILYFEEDRLVRMTGDRTPQPRP